MNEIRMWSITVCVAAAGCGIVCALAPKNATGKILTVIVSSFFVCCLILPILKVFSLTEPDIDFLPESAVSRQLSEKVDDQLHKQVRETVEKMIGEALSLRKVKTKKIDVQTDTSENGGIYIRQITVTVDKQDVPIALGAQASLEEQFGTVVKIRGAA